MQSNVGASNQTSAGKVTWLPSGTRLKEWPPRIKPAELTL